jgi:hypothetical protein
MKSAWKRIAPYIVILIVFCAKPKPEWLKWQESLDLAYPNELSFKIDMGKKSYFEGEPLIFRMLVNNKIGIPKTIVHPGERTTMLAAGYQTFKVVTESDSVLRYSGYAHANLAMQPEDVIVLEPYDTLYFCAIVCPDLFEQYEYPMERVSLSSGNYIIESNVHLGTKFYPRPARSLYLTSHPTMLSVESLPYEERDHLSKIRPYMKNFFGHAEECFFPPNNDYEKFIDSAFFWLDKVRNTSSYFAPYADFVYTCLPAVIRIHSDTVKLIKSISEAGKFIDKYNGSILAEEMEFKRVWWLFRKDSTSAEFYEKAREVVEKYPKNINSYGIRKHIPGGF